MSMSDFLDKDKIEKACALLSDTNVLRLAKWLGMTYDGVARQHLDNFMKNIGGTVKIDLQRLVNMDIKVQQRVRIGILQNIRDVGAETGKYGVINIVQDDYSINDWRLAIGAMNISWTIARIDEDMVDAHLTVIDAYDWHPEKDIKTQCVHQSAQNLVAQGKAATFIMYGEARLLVRVPSWYPRRKK